MCQKKIKRIFKKFMKNLGSTTSDLGFDLILFLKPFVRFIKKRKKEKKTCVYLHAFCRSSVISKFCDS